MAIYTLPPQRLLYVRTKANWRQIIVQSAVNSAKRTCTVGELLVGRTEMALLHCSFCSAIFATERLLRAHEARHRRVYACRVCHTHYPTRYSLFRHTKRAGHYLYPEQAAALPHTHHIAFKGRGFTTRGPSQFGRNSKPPTVQRQMPKSAIRDLYRPRVASTKVINFGPGKDNDVPSFSRVKVEPKIPKKSTKPRTATGPSSTASKPSPPQTGQKEKIEPGQPSTSDGRTSRHTTRFEVVDMELDSSLLDSDDD